MLAEERTGSWPVQMVLGSGQRDESPGVSGRDDLRGRATDVLTHRQLDVNLHRKNKHVRHVLVGNVQDSVFSKRISLKKFNSVRLDKSTV